MEFNFEYGQAYCAVCCSVVSKSSKHCAACSRCVDHFDHHCKWLNNCISKTNYRAFIGLIVSFQVNQLIQVGFSIGLIAEYFSDYQALSHRLQAVFDFSDAEIVFLGFYIAALSLSFPVAVLNLNLIGLHIMLYYRGMSTYEWIISRRITRVADEEHLATSVTITNGPSAEAAKDNSIPDFLQETTFKMQDRLSIHNASLDSPT